MEEVRGEYAALCTASKATQAALEKQLATAEAEAARLQAARAEAVAEAHQAARELAEARAHGTPQVRALSGFVWRAQLATWQNTLAFLKSIDFEPLVCRVTLPSRRCGWPLRRSAACSKTWRASLRCVGLCASSGAAR